MNESGDLTTLSQNKPVAYKHPKTFKNELSHHLRYFRFTHRTKFQTTVEDSELIGDDKKESEKIDAASSFFNRIPEPSDSEGKPHPDDDGFDSEHHMLASGKTRPIKAWS